MNREQWFMLDSGPADAAYNMALDEALLEFAPQIGQSVLRFYGWTQSAASFGYFQRISEIEAVTALRPLVRRPTGGGLVPHDADWTYSVVIPPQHDWHGLRASESYERMHQWIQSALASLGVSTELAPCCRKEIPGQCFAGYEKADLLWLGRKIAGAAQRRTKTGLLIQGSIQTQPSNISRQRWQQAMCDVRSGAAVSFRLLVPDKAVLNYATELAREKYGWEGYHRRR